MRTADHAAGEYRPTSDYDLRGLALAQNMSWLPRGDGDRFLVAVHGYEFVEHAYEKGAVLCRPGPTRDEYEVDATYFADGRGAIRQPPDAWRARRLAIDDGTMRCWARDRGDRWHLLGKREDCARDSFAEVDIMTELQYQGDVGLDGWPDKQTRNATVLNWCVTDQGWRRPGECLKWAGLGDGIEDSAGEYARITKVEDDDGRWWFYHWLEREG